ncbi:MBL fold metallo-hydrolase [Vibrio salinus]|uniref:MBL fold metallo-hydrolase n=1 Tax=Vibrio salinus TaxID=2899784 RepID=UPI001E3D9EED|nr:MBL fold metallo-hydrolase [Vibrio salinus]MCE0495553.1 MBL fold metallo-hydrolase [Vibrio salinus]
MLDYSQMMVGDYTISALSDGGLTADVACLSNIEIQEAHRILERSGKSDPGKLNINCFLIQGKGKTILVDSGAGGINQWGGQLPDQLRLQNIHPDEIDIILLTHAHPDHIGGLLTHEDNVMFPNAMLYIHQNEYDFWLSEFEFDQANERAKRNFTLARKVLANYAGKINTFQKGEIISGINAVPLPGHTPGHSGFLIESAEQRLLIWGDIVHFPEIQIAHPEVTIAFDYDKQEASLTRKQLLHEVSQQQLTITGMHLVQSCFAKIHHINGEFVIDYPVNG